MPELEADSVVLPNDVEQEYCDNTTSIVSRGRAIEPVFKSILEVLRIGRLHGPSGEAPSINADITWGDSITLLGRCVVVDRAVYCSSGKIRLDG